MDQQQAEQLKEGARVAWASGDFDVVAKLIWGVGPDLVQRVGVGAGQDVLDVAAGTGNASIPAAEAGARVVASDLTPELFEAGRRNAAEAGVEIEWVEADAERLPFDDRSFDVVLSSFGIMFAPRHEVAAAEAAVGLYEETFGPLMSARKALESEGRWQPLRDDLVALFESESEASGQGIRYVGEYLITIGTKRG